MNNSLNFKFIIVVFTGFVLSLTACSQNIMEITTNLKEVTLPDKFTYDFLRDVNLDTIQKIDTNICWKIFSYKGHPIYKYEKGTDYSTYLLGKKYYKNSTGYFLLINNKSNSFEVNRILEFVLFEENNINFTNVTICEYQKIFRQPEVIVESEFDGDKIKISEGMVDFTGEIKINYAEKYNFSSGMLKQY